MTSPLYMRQQAMYFPCLGSHLAIMAAGSKELLVVSLLGGDDWSIGREHEMDSGVGHQVGLELSDIDVKGTIESEGGGQGRDNLSDESVQVGVGGSLDIEVSSADIVDGLVVDHNSNIGVLEEG